MRTMKFLTLDLKLIDGLQSVSETWNCSFNCYLVECMFVVRRCVCMSVYVYTCTCICMYVGR